MFLSETSLTKISVNSLAHPLGYLYEIVYRRNQYKKERNSEGILVYHRKELKDKIHLHDTTSENIMWLKVTKSVVTSTKEAYIADVYNNPRNSIYSKKNDLNKLYIFLDNN